MSTFKPPAILIHSKRYTFYKLLYLKSNGRTKVWIDTWKPLRTKYQRDILKRCYMWIKQHSVLDKEEKISFVFKALSFLEHENFCAYCDVIIFVFMIKERWRNETLRWYDLHWCK